MGGEGGEISPPLVGHHTWRSEERPERERTFGGCGGGGNAEEGEVEGLAKLGGHGRVGAVDEVHALFHALQDLQRGAHTGHHAQVVRRELLLRTGQPECRASAGAANPVRAALLRHTGVKEAAATYHDGRKEGLALGERLAQPEARKQESCGAAQMVGGCAPWR